MEERLFAIWDETLVRHPLPNPLGRENMSETAPLSPNQDVHPNPLTAWASVVPNLSCSRAQ